MSLFPSYPFITSVQYSYSLSKTLSLICPIVEVSKNNGSSLADIESYITSSRFLSFQAWISSPITKNAFKPSKELESLANALKKLSVLS